ncbi:MAG: SMI1/KNR4 family protein [Flavobacteriales bacterium]|nr:SMI1/KNR4 family protein [Flavobacteriales bacterium]
MNFKELIDSLKLNEDDFVIANSVSEKDLIDGEKMLDVKFPEDFREFILEIGVGDLYGYPLAPFDYKFDQDCWEMEGCLAFYPMDGDHWAFDRDMKIVYCSHDPFGYGKFDGSFTDWLKFFVDLNNQESNALQKMNKIDQEINQNHKRYKEWYNLKNPKKWYQFWR